MRKIEKQYVEHGSFKGIIEIACVNFNDEYTKQIENIIEKNPRNYIKVLKSKGFDKRYVDRSYLYDYIIEVTPLLDDHIYTFKTRVYWALHKMTTFPWCLNDSCGDHQMIGINIGKMKDGYHKYCNTRCQHEDPKYYEHLEDAFERKYGNGIRNPGQIPEVKFKLAARKDEIQAKRDETRQKHFPGDKGWNLNKSIKTRKKLYGSTFNLTACKKTWKDKYGVESPMQNSEVRQKQQSAAYIFDGKKFDSSWEVYYYVWLQDNGIKFKYQPDDPKLFYKKSDGSVHRYYPDFLLVDNNQLVEIKGDNAFNKDGNPIKNGKLDWTEKFKCMIYNNVKILVEADIKQFKEYFEKKFGRKFINKFKVHTV